LHREVACGYVPCANSDPRAGAIVTLRPAGIVLDGLVGALAGTEVAGAAGDPEVLVEVVGEPVQPPSVTASRNGTTLRQRTLRR
jgi:hypothetical protein